MIPNREEGIRQGHRLTYVQQEIRAVNHPGDEIVVEQEGIVQDCLDYRLERLLCLAGWTQPRLDQTPDLPKRIQEEIGRFPKEIQRTTFDLEAPCQSCLALQLTKLPESLLSTPLYYRRGKQVRLEAPSPRSPAKQDQASRSVLPARDSFPARPNATTTTNAPITTSSGAVTPVESITSPSRRPSAPAASALKSAPTAKKTGGGTAKKRSESRSGRPANRPKDATARTEQEDKSGNATRTGGGHSAKDKGKASAYTPRVDPAVLNLAKANFALYNAEAMVDKYRVETLELEKAIGVPLKEMAPEDQLQFRQLMTEFGQHRDTAKKERDSVIISFEKALHPYLSKYLDGMLKDMLPVHLAKARSKAEEHKVPDAAAVGTSNQMDTAPIQPPPSPHSAMETEAKSGVQPVTEIQDGPLVQHDTATGSSSKPLPNEGAARNSASEAVDANEVDHALNMAETSVPMEVDVDRPLDSSKAQLVGSPHEEQESVLPLPGHTQADLSNGTSLPPADGVTLNKQDRRKLVGERLKVLEDGLKSTSTTTEELAVKIEKLEEQIANQEEQLYEYLNTQALGNEGRAEDAITHPDSTEDPSKKVATKEAIVETLVSASKIEEAVLETARAALETRLAELARNQDTQMAALAKANEARLLTLRNEIRAEISVEAARAEEAYAGAIQSAEEKASKLETQLATLQAELLSFKEERKAIEELKDNQTTSDQLLKTIRESTLKAQLTESQNRTAFNSKFGELEIRLDAHDAQLKDMKSFPDTKVAWRNDIIDMKDHVIGRVDYVEELAESLRTPEVAAITNSQPTQPSTALQVERQEAAQRTQENPAIRSQAQPPAQTAIQAAQPPQPQPSQLPLHRTAFPVSRQSANQITNPNDRSQYPGLGSLSSSAENLQARLALNRGGGSSLSGSVLLAQPAAAPGHSVFQPAANSLTEYTAGGPNASHPASTSGQNLSSTANQSFGQSWQPARTLQQPQGPVRLSPLHIDDEQGNYQPRSTPMPGRSTSSGSPVPHVNPAPEGTLSSRLNGGGDMRSPVPRPDSTPASTLPLVMRMHNGNGVPNSHGWMQMNSQPNSTGVYPPNGGGSAQQQLPNEASSGGRLRMYAPGDVKPPQS
ncbi:hypothetical protein QFC21_004174 [Naganishia friedmannii]|uniref:Uncharacterized protein n=1 Tax=Naganishia friedmannii TaxID=89922 RepID=A0ACC2VIT2_9TREE|nr:hypothetical protein QFC21_004174 [Naganishia friedmannii]